MNNPFENFIAGAVITIVISLFIIGLMYVVDFKINDYKKINIASSTKETFQLNKNTFLVYSCVRKVYVK